MSGWGRGQPAPDLGAELKYFLSRALLDDVRGHPTRNSGVEVEGSSGIYCSLEERVLPREDGESLIGGEGRSEVPHIRA